MVEFITGAGTHLTVASMKQEHTSTGFTIVDVLQPNSTEEVTNEHLVALLIAKRTLLSVEKDLSVAVHKRKGCHHEEEFKLVILQKTDAILPEHHIEMVDREEPLFISDHQNLKLVLAIKQTTRYHPKPSLKRPK